MGTRIGTAALCTLLLSFGSGSVLAQDKALLVSADSTSYRIKLLAGIFLPFTKSCSAKVTLPSEEAIWAQVPRDDPVIRIPKSKVAASDEIKISGGNHEYNGKNVLACIMLPAKIELAAAAVKGGSSSAAPVAASTPNSTTSPATTTAITSNPEADSTATANSAATPDAGDTTLKDWCAKYPSADKCRKDWGTSDLTMEQALAIDKEVQSRHVIWPVSGDLQSRIEKAINENKPWHSLVIDQVLSGKTTSAITAKTSPGSYAISEKTKKEYFDAILNQGQSGPWALAVAPDGCARRYQSMTLWNSKWSALRKCKKDCKSEACQILYVYKTRQPLGEAGNDSESTVASKRSLESVKVITLLERDKRVVGKLIFLASNHLVTRYRFWSSEKEEFFLEDAIFTNLREKTPVYRETHSAYHTYVVVLPGGKAVGFPRDDADHVVPVEGCCEKKYEIKDWTAGQWDFGGLAREVPAGYEAFYEADTSGFILGYFDSLFHFDGEHLTSLGRQVGSGWGG